MYKYVYIIIQIDLLQNIHNITNIIISIMAPTNKQLVNTITFAILCMLICCSNSTVVVNQITGVTSNNLMFTGTISYGNQKLFYIYYGVDGQTSVDNLQNKPLYIAIGSPGRSSQYINLGGLGPKWLNKDLTLADNPNRVTQFANILFVDNIGSGYSFASSAQAIPKTLKQFGVIVTKSINTFINETNIGKSKAIYIIGQSTFIRTLPGFDDINNLKGIIHISSWFDLYQIGKYYGTGGVQMKIFTDSERITIQSTFINCYNFQRSSKFIEAHQCYQTTLNYIQSRTKNRNLFNIQLQSNLTQVLPMIQYYFSQSSVVNTIKAPNTNGLLFEAHSAQVSANIYQDLGKNIDSTISQYLKDYLNIKQIFITTDYDFITYRKALRNWLENSITFVESTKFKTLNLTEFNIDGKIAGYTKGVPQITYYQLLNSGHFAYNDVPHVINTIVRNLVTLNQLEQHNNENNQHNEDNEDVKYMHEKDIMNLQVQ